MSKNNKFVIIALLILLALCFILYIISLGQINVISDAESELKEKRRIAEEKLKELEEKLQIQVPKKKKLDKLVTALFIVFKIICVSTFVGLNLYLKHRYHINSWTELFEANVKLIGCFTFLLLVFIGEELNFFRYYRYLRATIKSFVYRKYGNLESEIEQNQNQAKQLKDFLDETNSNPG